MDRALQAAIYNSIQSGGGGRGGSYGGRSSYSSSSRSAPRSTRHVSRASSRVSRASYGTGRTFDSMSGGRKSTLSREGILPQSKRAGAKADGRRARREQGGSKVSDKFAGKVNPATDRKHKLSIALGGGWFQRTDPPMRGKFAKAGLHIVVESKAGGQFYLCTYSPEADDARSSMREGTLDVRLSVKPSSLDGVQNAHTRVHVILGYKSPTEFLCLTGDAEECVWRLDAFMGKLDGAQCLGTVPDATLKANRFCRLFVQLRGNVIAVSRNNEAIFQGLRVQPTLLRGEVGVSCMRSRMVFKEFEFSPRTKSSPAARPAQKVRGAAKTETRPERMVRDGCLTLPASYEDAAARAGVEPTIAAASKSPYVGDDRHIVDIIESDIIMRNLGVSFDDVAALDDAKRLLSEAVSLPLLVPELFTGIRESWKGVLLYGPQGVGKTLMAKAAASVDEITFFNASAASLISKWRGESEKILRCLFRMARHYAPSIIFIDEIDAISRQRGNGNEHEADRRIKSAMFSEMDGIHSSAGAETGEGSPPRVVVLATTNVPWDLDDAMRRRLEKRIYVPLPELEARKKLVHLCLNGVDIDATVDISRVAAASDGYSGADIRMVCREAAMAPMRRMIEGKSATEIVKMRNEGMLKSPPPLCQEDFDEAFRRIKASVSSGAQVQRYKEWERQFGSV